MYCIPVNLSPFESQIEVHLFSQLAKVMLADHQGLRPSQKLGHVIGEAPFGPLGFLERWFWCCFFCWSNGFIAS